MEVAIVRLRLPRLGLAVVRGRSMEPTLRAGDRLVVAYGLSPRVGQLVVVRLPDRPVSVKRVTRQVDDGWWVERDNPAEGTDSWQVGAIPADDVLAMVLCRVWPVHRNHPTNDDG
jgi:signal peptidase I